jgi:hypothetical protein
VVAFLSNLYQLPLPESPITFHPPLIAEIIRQVYRVPINVDTRYLYLWTFELPGEDLSIHQYHPPEARLEATVHRFWPLRLVFR